METCPRERMSERGNSIVQGKATSTKEAPRASSKREGDTHRGGAHRIVPED
ncbi:hypothetical protein [Demequina sp. NBRC 110054]|uniref:hypothetical protein n=1 Tax=Demequina sp. NBRC 110054 TaxID=1570343 RepID=UPI00135648FE|nr:hypothetical protein [Demequina sp. NBRC 110054]